MKFPTITPLTPLSEESNAPVCTDGVCEVPEQAADTADDEGD